MVLSWFKARDAVEAGTALADSFPTQTTTDFVREFLKQAAQELRARKLSFYKRVRFANAFKWRLLEKGMPVETAHDVTQTLLISSLVLPAATPAAARKPASRAQALTTATAIASATAADTVTVNAPTNRKALDALIRQGNQCFGRGAYEDAVTYLQEYVTGRPKDSVALNMLGAALIKLGRYGQARKYLHNAVAHNPKNADALCNLGSLFSSQGRFADAENYFRRALRIAPANPLIRINLGRVLAHQGLLDKSREEFDKVLKTAPRDAGALAGLGTVERALGHFADAEQMFRRALQTDPNLTAALAGIASSRRMTAADSQWLGLAEAAVATVNSVPDEASLRFAIGKYFDDLGDYSRAFESYQRANTLLKPLATPYDERKHSRFVNDMTCVYTLEALASVKSSGSISTRPVFVVGMPRSGTSLLEQILSSHPAVAGAGELKFWMDAVAGDEATIRKELLPPARRQQLAAEYLQTLQSRHPNAGYVVDKTPHNADYLGLIHSVFPDARIIYLRRDPIDTCLSCYFQNFSLALNYTFDLNDLAGHYRQHARLMAHWRKVLPPGTLLDVPYEELVSQQETWTRKILAFLSLEWDVNCLKFNENPRPVVTASSWQVRQPIYGDSVKRWRRYSRFVEPLRKLDPA